MGKVSAITVCVALAFNAGLAQQLPGPSVSTDAIKQQYTPESFKPAWTATLASEALADVLFDSTVHLIGNSGQCTGAIMGRPDPQDSRRGDLILITAAHCFEHEQGMSIALKLRRKVQPPLAWITVPIPIAIRKDGKPLWVKHPDEDVAALSIWLPGGILEKVPATTMLATEAVFESLKPGREVKAIGYPLGAEGSFGFGLIRPGMIASQIVSGAPTFYIAFPVFRGDSGGPVYYIIDKPSAEATLIGLIIESLVFREPIKQLQMTGEIVHPLGVAKVVSAPIVAETIRLLPLRNPNSSD